MRRYRYTVAFASTIAGSVAAGLSGAWLPPSHPWLWPVREAIAWLAGGIIAAGILARTDRP